MSRTRIIRALESQELTIQDAARVADVSRPSIYKFKDGKRLSQKKEAQVLDRLGDFLDFKDSEAKISPDQIQGKFQNLTDAENALEALCLGHKRDFERLKQVFEFARESRSFVERHQTVLDDIVMSYKQADLMIDRLEKLLNRS